MMAKSAKLILLSLVHMAALLSGEYAIEAQAKEEKKTIQLTEAQKNELSALHKNILVKKKQLLSKYMEFGIISEDKSEKIISCFEKRFSQIEKNGFVSDLCEENKTIRNRHWHDYLKRIMPLAASLPATI